MSSQPKMSFKPLPFLFRGLPPCPQYQQHVYPTKAWLSLAPQPPSLGSEPKPGRCQQNEPSPLRFPCSNFNIRRAWAWMGSGAWGQVGMEHKVYFLWEMTMTGDQFGPVWSMEEEASTRRFPGPKLDLAVWLHIRHTVLNPGCPSHSSCGIGRQLCSFQPGSCGPSHHEAGCYRIRPVTKVLTLVV